MVETAEARRTRLFWSRVTRSPGCWTHAGAPGSHGYPQATHPHTGRSEPAHRVGWLLQVGAIPTGSMVLHACNNRSCVRAERGHLYLGDHAQNMDDLSRVGHPRRALTAEQVLEVRASTEATRAIARRMGVSQKTVQRVRRGMIYRHVNPGGHQERG